MAPAGKKNRGRLDPREKKLYGRLIWLLVGPAVFFALYWFYAGGGVEKPRDRLSPPEKYLQAGQGAKAGGVDLLAAPGGRVAHTGELALAGNRVLAESGLSFLVIPLAIPEGSKDPSPSRWFLIDQEGRKYNLLKVLGASPAKDLAPAPGPGSRLVYLVFKVEKGLGPTFLVYNSGNEQPAWKIPGPGGTGG